MAPQPLFVEAGTTALAVGGPAGSFTPSAWEARWLAELPPEDDGHPPGADG